MSTINNLIRDKSFNSIFHDNTEPAVSTTVGLRAWADVNIHYTTSFNELLERYSASFNKEEVNVLKNHLINYHTYFDSTRKIIEKVNDPEQIIDYARLFSEQTRNLHEQLRKIYTTLPICQGKSALFGLIKAFTTANNNQQKIFN